MSTQDIPTTYNSSTLGPVSILNLEEQHLKNTIMKVSKEIIANDGKTSYPPGLLQALTAELQRRHLVRNPEPRQLPSVVGEALTIESKANAPQAESTTTEYTNTCCGGDCTPAPATENKAVAKRDISFDTLFDSLIAAMGRVQFGAPKAKQTLTERITALVETVNNEINAPQAHGELVICADTQLSSLTEAYPALTTRGLRNSMASYGIYSVGDLADIAACDFGAIRFSSAEAFVEATHALNKASLSWFDTSQILIRDGYINSTLNPACSKIETFVTQADLRLQPLIKGILGEGGPLMNDTYTKVNRIFEGIKHRIALAVSTVGVALLVRGVRNTTEVDQNAETELSSRSIAFMRQVELYLARTRERVLKASQQQHPVEA